MVRNKRTGEFRRDWSGTYKGGLGLAFCWRRGEGKVGEREGEGRGGEEKGGEGIKEATKTHFVVVFFF